MSINEHKCFLIEYRTLKTLVKIGKEKKYKILSNVSTYGMYLYFVFVL